MNFRTLLTVILSAGAVCSQAQMPAVLPLPAEMTPREGQFRFTAKTAVSVADYPGDSVRQVYDRWSNDFRRATGLSLRAGAKPSRAGLVLALDDRLPAEGYRLEVTPERVEIAASRPAGFFYALQTLGQLMPSRAVVAGVADTLSAWTVPAVSIADAPRFGWRGFMLDEGRHFYGTEAIKKVLDVMAAYKMNRFHWHLTEDQGWRIEIKKYPKLTETGAWRRSRVLGWGDTKPDGELYGGYYTQDDAREIVAYARERFIEIVPEVDIPGHSQAAVAAYPEMLSCDPDKPHGVWLWQGVSSDVINVANPKAVQFAKDVVDELADIFPYEYLHLGGDECPTGKWEANAGCRAQLEAIGSKNYRDLQINFYRQLKEHIAARPAGRQRKLIFWNEVLHGNTAPLGDDITIMAWVGADAAAQDAARRGLNTILSPQIPYYINRRQSPLATEPRSQGNGSETVEAVYNYVPQKGVDEQLRQKYLGVQANFWTEWVEDFSTVSYLMLPRLAAVAEAGWTPQARRSYPDFLKRLQAEPAYYRMKGMNYGKHVFK